MQSIGFGNPPSLTPPILSWDEYWAVCQGDAAKGELGIENQALAKDFLAVFSKIGVCLHYPDDAYLRDKIFLHPQWIIDALFALLYAEKIIGKNGHFTEEDVLDIWNQPHHKGMHRDLLRLIERFELAYSITSSDPKAYILPQRLPSAEESYPWQPAQKVVVVYDYKFMPRGIITRIICRLHRKIKDNAGWNNALVVAYQGEEAFIREVYSENRIVVEATTAHNTDVLNLVIDQIDEIHEYLRNRNLNLVVEKLVPCNCETCSKADEPHRFEYEYLCDLLKDGEDRERCQKSRKFVDISALLRTIGLRHDQHLKKESQQSLYIDDIRESINRFIEADPDNSFYQQQNGRLNDVERKFAEGVIDYEVYQLERNRIRAALPK